MHCRSCRSRARSGVPRPDFKTAAEGWLAAGGSHHTVFTSALGLEAFTDLAEIAAVELVSIGGR